MEGDNQSIIKKPAAKEVFLHLLAIFTLYGSAVSFLTVLMAWYGVNFVLGAGLHSYGFGGGGLSYVLAFVVTDILAIMWLARRFKTVSPHH